MNLVPPSHPALWTVAEPVIDFSGAVVLANKMMGLMAFKGGVGLAAPQVGVSQRLFVMRDGFSILTIINPAILSHGKDEETDMEGCLSFPEQRVPVKRWRVITVEYHNGIKVVKRTLKGMASRIFQHEEAHLRGECIFPRPQNPA